MQYAYTRLLVSDFKASFRFYRDVLGFKPTFGDENDVYADFKTDKTTIALFKRGLMAEAVDAAKKPSHAESQDRIALVFGVESVDEVYKQLKAKGVKFVTEPLDHSDWGIRTAHFRDPDGNLIEICSSLSS